MGNGTLCCPIFALGMLFLTAGGRLESLCPGRLECLTEPSLDEAPADETGGDVVEGGEDVGAPFVTDGDAAEAGEPGERTLDHPSVSAEAFAAFYAAPGNPRNDRPPAAGEVIALVGVQLGRSAPWSARHWRIAGTASTSASRSLLSCRLAGEILMARRMPLASTRMCRLEPGLPRSVGFGPVSSPPFPAYAGTSLAGTLALSTAARSQLMALA